MYRDQSTLGVVHICLVLTQMIAMSPSNAHTERQIKAMNNIKTIHRTTLGQAKLNNQYKIAMNSLPPKLFDPQPVIDHYVRKSTESLDKQQPIVLQCGQQVPNIFRMKGQYKTGRSKPGKRATSQLGESILANSSPAKSLKHAPHTGTNISEPVTPQKRSSSSPSMLVDLRHSPTTPRPSDAEFDALNKSHKIFMKANKAIVEAVFPPEKVVVLDEFLSREEMHFLRTTESRNREPNITVFDMKSLLSSSNTTSDILFRYQAMLSNNNPSIYFVPPTLFHVLSQEHSVPEQLELPDFHQYRFMFWPIYIPGKKKHLDHWVTALHSTRDNAHLYYMDTWGTKDQIEARVPPNVLESINGFLAQQKPPRTLTSMQVLNAPPQQENSCGCCVNEFARRLCEGADVLFGMQPFEPSNVLRIKQAKEIFDFILAL